MVIFNSYVGHHQRVGLLEDLDHVWFTYSRMVICRSYISLPEGSCIGRDFFSVNGFILDIFQFKNYIKLSHIPAEIDIFWQGIQGSQEQDKGCWTPPFSMLNSLPKFWIQGPNL